MITQEKVTISDVNMMTKLVETFTVLSTLLVKSRHKYC